MSKKNRTDEFIDDYVLFPVVNGVQSFALYVGGCFGLLEREVALLLYNIRFGFPGHNLVPDVPRLLSNTVGNAALLAGAVGSMYFGANVASFCICRRDCKACNGWKALRCTMCTGSGKVPFHLRNFNLKDGEPETSRTIATAVVDGRADVEHLPPCCGFESAFPSTDCPTCKGSGVMLCPKCGTKSTFRFSHERVFDVPWNTWNVVRKCELPSEHILEDMQNPDMAAFRLFARPELEGGFQYDEDVKQKIWWKYKEFMRYQAAQKFVGDREPGWEYMQKFLFALNPIRARGDPVVAHDVPYEKAKRRIEAEVMSLEPPPRPFTWTPPLKSLNIALKDNDLAEEDLKDPKVDFEKLSAQNPVIEGLLDKTWEKHWRKLKYDELVEERIRPFMEKLEAGVYPIEVSKEVQVTQPEKVMPKKRSTWFRWRRN